MNNLHYHNESSKMVILRCVGPESFFREKVMLPYEDFIWDCPAESRVDIWSYGLTGAELVDSIEAAQLVVAGSAASHCSARTPLMGTIQVEPRRSEFFKMILDDGNL